jgi:diguanylate cyclase (GGDEF)-like protein
MEILKNDAGLEEIIVDLVNSLSAVKDLSELDYQVVNEKELIRNALSVLIQNQDMERCSLFLLDEHNVLVNLTGLSASESSGGVEKKYTPLQFKVGEGVVGTAALTGKMQHCQNCAEDICFTSDKKQGAVKVPGSLISVPVYASNELVGVLNISHPQTHYFTEWHFRMLEIYKNMLGQLITNYRMFRQMETKISKRTEKLEGALADLKVLKNHFESISMIDQLTGLYNRRYFYDQAEIAIANAKRYGQGLCLLVLDLDHFKEVNDLHGHGFGDNVLVKISKALQLQVRESDVLVRFGGEEFVIIFPNTNCINGKIFAERIRKKVEQLEWEGCSEYAQTISIGMYCLNDDCCAPENDDINIDKLVNFADLALYQAKAQGRNKVILFDENLLEK